MWKQKVSNCTYAIMNGLEKVAYKLVFCSGVEETILRIRTGGGLLWVRQWTFGFHKMRGISWVAEELSASQGGLCSMKLVTTEVAMACPNWTKFYFIVSITTCFDLYQVIFKFYISRLSKIFASDCTAYEHPITNYRVAFSYVYCTGCSRVFVPILLGQ
jgi:hypothetical protein